MSLPSHIPEQLGDFLVWLKQETEAAWAAYPTKTFEEFLEDGVGGSSWRARTKWQEGLEPKKIDAIEARWNIRFPDDYRQFLSSLNAPDRGAYHVGWADEPPYDMQEGKDTATFYDWNRDVDEIRAALNWPLEGLLFSVEEDGFWMETWGPRPKKAGERREALSSLISKAPKLVPLVGHRYLLVQPLQAGNPVLSVYGPDIIYYANDLRHLLVLELSELLDLNYSELAHTASDGFRSDAVAEIPFWGELILRD